MTKVFIIAGEESGDQLGAALLSSLYVADPTLEVRGIGGEKMLSAGLHDSLFKMEELSVMGLFEIAPKIFHFMDLIAKAVMAIKVFDPDIVVTIDSPEFSFRVQERLKKLGVRAKKIHYVAPTVWAWRPKRARHIARFLDGIICLFPFEPPYFQREGLPAIAVGHPVLQAGVLQGDGQRFRKDHNILPESPVLGLFFGSRRSEIERLSPVILEVAKKLASENPNLFFLVPTIERWAEPLSNLMKGAGLNFYLTTDRAEKWDAFRSCTAALAVSGTVALEISLAGVPHAIVYQMNEATWQIVRRLVCSKFAHLANILLGHLVVPEFIQSDAVPEKIIPVMRRVLFDAAERQIQIAAFTQVQTLLQSPSKRNAADEAAAFTLTPIRET